MSSVSRTIVTGPWLRSDTCITAPNQVWTARQTLRSRLRLLFHQRLLQPVGPFVYLVLVGLDLERLRASLVDRALFVSDEVA